MPLRASERTASRASSTASISGRTDPPEPAAAGDRGGGSTSPRASASISATRRSAASSRSRPDEPGEQEVVLGEHLPEHGRDPPQRLRDGQEPERVPGGRRVDDDRVVAARLRHARELEEPAQLVDAGEAQAEEAVDVRLVEIGAALGDEAEGRAPRAEPAGERPVGVELEGIERSRRPPGSRVTRAPTPAPEHVTQGVRRIGRHDERAPAGAGGREREGGRRGGLAHPALAADELVAGRPAPGARPAHRPARRRGRRSSSSPSSSPTTLASTPVTRKVPGGSGAPLLRARGSRGCGRAASRSIARRTAAR